MAERSLALHRLRLVASCVMLASFAIASAQMIPPSSQSTGCPIKVEEYVVGEATTDLVKRCLGAPRREARGDQGTIVYLYNIDGLGDVSFMFDSAGKLLRARVHESFM
jgi:hypothetical protein